MFLFLSCFLSFSDNILHVFVQPVGLGKIAKLINAGKIDSSELITMKTLKVQQKYSRAMPFPSSNEFNLLITITIGYRGNREADKRWSEINGTWC